MRAASEKPVVVSLRLTFAAALLLPALLVLAACSSTRDSADDNNGNDASPENGASWDERPVPGWLLGEIPNEEYHFVVSEVIFPEGLPRTDAIRRAGRQAQEQIMQRLGERRDKMKEHLAELIAENSEAEAMLRAEAEAFARQHDQEEVYPPQSWLEERVWQHLLLALLDEEATAIHEVYLVREGDEIDEDAHYFDGLTGERIQPSPPGPDRLQVFVLVGTSRDRLAEIFRQEVGHYGIELDEHATPHYLLAPFHE